MKKHEDRITALKIPHEKLEPESLQALIEEFVTREGTDYGKIEVSFEQKVAQVRSQLMSGQAIILFDVDTQADYEKLIERFQCYQVPTERECTVILRDINKVTQQIRNHSHKVTKIADLIGQALSAAGMELDKDAIHASAWLHDIAKGQKDHAAVGGQLLRKMGFGRVGDIVEEHADLTSWRDSSLEAKVVYLADKYVIDESIVPLEERFGASLRRFGSNVEIGININLRRQKALDVKRELDNLLGYPLDSVIFSG